MRPTTPDIQFELQDPQLCQILDTALPVPSPDIQETLEIHFQGPEVTEQKEAGGTAAVPITKPQLLAWAAPHPQPQTLP